MDALFIWYLTSFPGRFLAPLMITCCTDPETHYYTKKAYEKCATIVSYKKCIVSWEKLTVLYTNLIVPYEKGIILYEKRIVSYENCSVPYEKCIVSYKAIRTVWVQQGTVQATRIPCFPPPCHGINTPR